MIVSNLFNTQGTDEVSGTAVQARHSYRWDDVKFDCTFSNCVFPIGDDHSSIHNKRKSDISLDESEIEPSNSQVRCMIDFRKFHSVIAAPIDGEFCAFIPQWIYDKQHEKEM